MNNTQRLFITLLYRKGIAVINVTEIQNGYNLSLFGGYLLSIYHTGKYVVAANTPQNIKDTLEQIATGTLVE